jgi:hypothetical protein
VGPGFFPRVSDEEARRSLFGKPYLAGRHLTKTPGGRNGADWTNDPVLCLFFGGTGDSRICRF